MIPEHPRRRRTPILVPATTAAVLAALVAWGACGAAAGADEAEADREAKADRLEAAREKSLLDGTSTRPRSWQLDTRMLPNDTTGKNAEKILAPMLKPRSDTWADWSSPLEPLHHCGEPRALPPRCVPPPPCHPSQPPHPYDLVGAVGAPSGGPIYDGPCAPRTGTHDDCPHHRVRRAYDRFFDWFYMWK